MSHVDMHDNAINSKRSAGLPPGVTSFSSLYNYIDTIIVHSIKGSPLLGGGGAHL